MPREIPGQSFAYECSAAGSGTTAAVAAAIVAAAAETTVTAAEPDDNQQDDDPAAVAAAIAVIAHIGTSYEMLAEEDRPQHIICDSLQRVPNPYRRVPETASRASFHAGLVNTPLLCSRSASVWVLSGNCASSA